MQAVFSPTITVISCVCEYLRPKEICHTRQVSKFNLEHLYNFQEFAESNGAIFVDGLIFSFIKNISKELNISMKMYN